MARAAVPSRSARVVAALEHATDRPWFLPSVAAFPLADYVLPFLPNQTLLMTLAILRPTRWAALALTFASAGAFGALLSAYAVQAVAPQLFDALFGGAPDTGATAKVLAAVDDYGLWTLAALAMLPWPPRTALIVCALAGLSPASIALAIGAGRVVPSGSFGFLGSKAPHFLRRLRSVDRVLREVEALRDQSKAGLPDHP